MERAKRAKGELSVLVRTLIDAAPWGWSHCVDHSATAMTERSMMGAIVEAISGESAQHDDARFTEQDPGPPVSPQDTSNVAFVYVFDVESRRLDAFATHVEAKGERIGSVVFAANGEPDSRALDLLPEEKLDEAPLPGPHLSAQTLTAWLRELPQLEAPGRTFNWVVAEEGPEGALVIVVRAVDWDDAGSISNVIEQAWNVVPSEARAEPQRVRNFLDAFVTVATKHEWLNAFEVASIDALRRSGARQRDTFERVLCATKGA